jgi:hypothetical protein
MPKPIVGHKPFTPPKMAPVVTKPMAVTATVREHGGGPRHFRTYGSGSGNTPPDGMLHRNKGHISVHLQSL